MADAKDSTVWSTNGINLTYTGINVSFLVGNELTGNTNLITHYNLEHAYNKFCGKKVKEKLSNFLPELPGRFYQQTAANEPESRLEKTRKTATMNGWMDLPCRSKDFKLWNVKLRVSVIVFIISRG